MNCSKVIPRLQEKRFALYALSLGTVGGAEHVEHGLLLGQELLVGLVEAGAGEGVDGQPLHDLVVAVLADDWVAEVCALRLACKVSVYSKEKLKKKRLPKSTVEALGPDSHGDPLPVRSADPVAHVVDRRGGRRSSARDAIKRHIILSRAVI